VLLSSVSALRQLKQTASGKKKKLSFFHIQACRFGKKPIFAADNESTHVFSKDKSGIQPVLLRTEKRKDPLQHPDFQSDKSQGGG
jgi:hypothetical protein